MPRSNQQNLNNSTKTGLLVKKPASWNCTFASVNLSYYNTVQYKCVATKRANAQYDF